jgi:hypothetical protein
VFFAARGVFKKCLVFFITAIIFTASILSGKIHRFSMSRFKETEKPFEKFLRVALYVWLAAILTVGFLILIGVIKRPSKIPSHSIPAAEVAEPSNFRAVNGD